MTIHLQEIRLELEAPHALGTRWGTAVIGAYFLLQGPAYLFRSANPSMAVVGWVTLGASAVLLGVALSLWRLPVKPGRSETLATVGIAAILVQVLTHIVIGGNWIHTSDLMILVVSLSILIRRRSTFAGLLLVALGAWGIAASLDHRDVLLQHWVLGMTSASLASVVIFLHLRRMWGSHEELMLRDRLMAVEEARLKTQLEEAMAKVQTLQGLIPICAHCKNIRNDRGYWEQVETFVSQRSEARFTHGICPTCMEKVRDEIVQFKQEASGPQRAFQPTPHPEEPLGP